MGFFLLYNESMKNNIYLNFPVVITQEEGRYVAFSPSIPGCHSQADTYEEAQKNIREAIELCLEVAEEDSAYRDRIDYGTDNKPRMISVSNISIARPNFA